MRSTPSGMKAGFMRGTPVRRKCYVRGSWWRCCKSQHRHFRCMSASLAKKFHSLSDAYLLIQNIQQSPATWLRHSRKSSIREPMRRIGWVWNIFGVCKHFSELWFLYYRSWLKCKYILKWHLAQFGQKWKRFLTEKIFDCRLVVEHVPRVFFKI